MIGFRKTSLSKEEAEKDQIRECDNGDSDIGSGYAATQVAFDATAAAKTKFSKPDSYSKNRKLFDSPDVKKNAKLKLFDNNKTVVDPYTGEALVLTKSEAKQLYGKDWQKHLAETDHVKPLERVYEDTKNNIWNTTDDIRNAANSDANVRVTSRKYNNPKRSRTNKEYVEDKEYLDKKGVKLTKKGKRQAIEDGDTAEQAINQQLETSGINNMVHTGHEAGIRGAQDAGITALTISGIMNFVSVLKGEKSSDEAIADTVRDSGKAAITGYAMGGGLTVASHSLSNSSSKFIKALTESNVPGKVITAVMVTGDTLRKWGTGEITTQQCIIELGDKGLNMATMGYSMAIGQTLIPVPVVGAAVGALVGSLLTSSYYNSLINQLQNKELEHKNRLRIIEECSIAVKQTKLYRKELEAYLEDYFSDYQDCFDSALSSMRFAFEVGDADGVIAGANDITNKLGKNVSFRSVSEFKSFLRSDEVDRF